MSLDPIYYNATAKLSEINRRIDNGTHHHYGWSFECNSEGKTQRLSSRLRVKKPTVKLKKDVPKKNPNQLPIISFPIVQPQPINHTNFHVATIGNFTEIKSIGATYKEFFKSKGSVYYVSKCKKYIIRKSDHWGANIKNCHWFLKGYPTFSCYSWNKKFGVKIGRIPLSELRPRKIKQRVLN